MAEAIFTRWLQEEEGIPVYYENRLLGVDLEGGRITQLVSEQGNIFRGQIFIDAGYEGDLSRLAGLEMVVGREGNDLHGETFNGVHFGKNHQFQWPIDPFVEQGNRRSGLLPGISPRPPGLPGSADPGDSSFTVRLTLIQEDEARKWGIPTTPISGPDGGPPEGYEELKRYYQLHVRNYLSHRDPSLESLAQFTRGVTTPMPRRKSDHNNYGPASLNLVGGSERWAECPFRPS